MYASEAQLNTIRLLVININHPIIGESREQAMNKRKEFLNEYPLIRKMILKKRLTKHDARRFILKWMDFSKEMRLYRKREEGLRVKNNPEELIIGIFPNKSLNKDLYD